jgi:outer membrane protein TolC
MDVLDARRQLSATRLEGLAVQTDYAKALAAWRAAVAAGGP